MLSLLLLLCRDSCCCYCWHCCLAVCCSRLVLCCFCHLFLFGFIVVVATPLLSSACLCCSSCCCCCLYSSFWLMRSFSWPRMYTQAECQRHGSFPARWSLASTAGPKGTLTFKSIHRWIPLTLLLRVEDGREDDRGGEALSRPKATWNEGKTVWLEVWREDKLPPLGVRGSPYRAVVPVKGHRSVQIPFVYDGTC